MVTILTHKPRSSSGNDNDDNDDDNNDDDDNRQDKKDDDDLGFFSTQGTSHFVSSKPAPNADEGVQKKPSTPTSLRSTAKGLPSLDKFGL